MSIVNPKIKHKIKVAINEVEQQSSCELVAVLSRISYNYSFVAIMVSAIVALIVPPFLMLSSLSFEAIRIYQIQVIVFVLLFLFLNIEYIARLLTPKSILKRNASQKAKESFMTLGLHQTDNHQAVMLFVSLFEHYVEIIVDDVVSERLSNESWQDIINKFTTDVQNGDFENGYLRAIESIGDILKTEFPRNDDSETILPNRLIEL